MAERDATVELFPMADACSSEAFRWLKIFMLRLTFE